MLLVSTSTSAQFICEIDSIRNWFYQADLGKRAEFSGLAYHPKCNLFLMPLDGPTCPLDPNEGDDPICPEKPAECRESNVNSRCPLKSVHIRGYDLNDNTPFDVQFSDATENLLTGCDFEGITHLKDDYFVLMEEDENKIYFLKYRPNDKQFDVISGHETGISPIPYPFTSLPCYTLGLGGISYDPNTSRLYVIDEFERKLYSAPIVLTEEILADGSTSAVFTVENFVNSSVSLGDESGADPTITIELFYLATGLFHLGQIYPANHPLANNILVNSFTDFIRPEIKEIKEFKISLDLNNDLTGSPELINVVDFNNIKIDGKCEPKPEGLVAIGNSIYVASEQFGLSSYTKKSISDSCENGYYSYDEDSQICKCVACPIQLWINTNTYNVNEDTVTIPLQGLYKSNESIETAITNSIDANVIIRNNETVDLKSNQIILNAGFEVEAGGSLNVEIEPCEE